MKLCTLDKTLKLVSIHNVQKRYQGRVFWLVGRWWTTNNSKRFSICVDGGQYITMWSTKNFIIWKAGFIATAQLSNTYWICTRMTINDLILFFTDDGTIMLNWYKYYQNYIYIYIFPYIHISKTFILLGICNFFFFFTPEIC